MVNLKQNEKVNVHPETANFAGLQQNSYIPTLVLNKLVFTTVLSLDAQDKKV